MVLHHHVRDALGGPDPRDGRLGGELDLDAMRADVVQLFQAGDLDQAPGADDADPVADVLDLGQDVRGQEDGGAAVAGLSGQGVELLLVGRAAAGPPAA